MVLKTLYPLCVLLAVLSSWNLAGLDERNFSFAERWKNSAKRALERELTAEKLTPSYPQVMKSESRKGEHYL